MTEEFLESCVALLSSRAENAAPGLTDVEFSEIQSRGGFRFPPDLKAVLAGVVPQGRGCPDWHDLDADHCRRFVSEVCDGVVFDIEYNDFWMDAWGRQPPELSLAKAVAESAIREAPIPIPIFEHRFIPAEPCIAGNPVFSIVQTDIIVYGSDLLTYLRHEFESGFKDLESGPHRIRTWSDLVDANAKRRGF